MPSIFNIPKQKKKRKKKETKKKTKKNNEKEVKKSQRTQAEPNSSRIRNEDEALMKGKKQLAKKNRSKSKRRSGPHRKCQYPCEGMCAGATAPLAKRQARSTY